MECCYRVARVDYILLLVFKNDEGRLTSNIPTKLKVAIFPSVVCKISEFIKEFSQNIKSMSNYLHDIYLTKNF